MGTEYGPAIDMFNDDPNYVFVGALGNPNVPNSDISIVCLDILPRLKGGGFLESPLGFPASLRLA